MSIQPAELDVPRDFAQSTIAREGAAGRAWIRDLPGIAGDLCDRWRLVRDGDVLHGYVALVVPVTRDGAEYVLKVSWIDVSSIQESLALRIWGGCGAVWLIDEQPALGAMLLERLDHRQSLEQVPEQMAATVAGVLLRRLAVAAPAEVRSVADEVSTLTEELPALWLRLGKPFPGRLLDRVIDLAVDLGREDGRLVVNADLHYANVLRGEREPWLVIDPKILTGDVEYGVAPLLWNRFSELRTSADFERRLAMLTEAALLDTDRSRQWALVRIVDYWLWALSVDLTKDPKKCRLLVEWLQ